MQKYNAFFLFSLLCLGVSCSSSKKKSDDSSKIVITENEPTRNDELKVTEIRNLAFRGGGVLGIVYAGALKVLEEQGHLTKLEGVSGTSAGSIMAALVALRYPITKKDNPNGLNIEDVVTQLPFKKFKDNKDPFAIASRYGLYSGDYFLKWMKKHVASSPLGLTETSTFRDLNSKGGLDLKVYSCDINRHKLVEFSYASTPDIPIAEAVRASMSIPLFFKAWQFSDDKMEGHFFVDGGTINGYPIDAFDDKNGANAYTLGLYQGNMIGDPVDNEFGHNHFLKYIKNTFLTLLQTQHTKLLEEADDMERTVFINVFDISPINFDITTNQQDSLKKSGVVATELYLKQNGLLKAD